MEDFKVGDIVARKSYNYDVIFKITRINSNGIIDLAGLTVRILADSPKFDLKKISEDELDRRLKSEEQNRRERLSRCYTNINKKFNYMNNQINYNNDNPNIFKRDAVLKKPGIVLHIDRRCWIHRKM